LVYRIAVIEGDGVGPEIMKEGIKVLKAAAAKTGVELEFVDAPAGGNAYKNLGSALPEESLQKCRGSDAIYKAPVGLPDITPGVVERDMILRLRQELDEYINLRPVKLYPELREGSPLKDRVIGEGIEFVVVRENSEGLYSRHGGSSQEVATDVSIFTKKGVDRCIRYAFELARKRNKSKKVTSVDKANVLTTSLFWRKWFNEIAKEYPDVKTESVYVDALTQYLIRRPGAYDVIVTENMFGDIITDEASEIVGSLGLGPSGNINPEGISMFEPLHGSAPDIAGKGIANPIGMILAAALMMRQLGEEKAALLIENAAHEAIKAGFRTKDIALQGEKACSTKEMGDAIAAKIR
jgi:3-isopropylmalate dehydrogenase